MKAQQSPDPFKAPMPYRDPAQGLLYLQVEVPVEWHEPVLRHHVHLVELASVLRGAGLSDEIITTQLETAIASYRAALIAAIQKSDRCPDGA